MTEPANLQDYILAEVMRKTSEEHIRQLIDKKIDEAIKGAVDDEFRYGGNLKKQLTTAVGAALTIGDKIDVPAYGVMVMALLREKLDANINELLNVKLASEMQDLLQIAPKELKFSDVIEKMTEHAKEMGSGWGKIAVFIEESDYSAGCYHVGIDPDGDTRKRYECDTQFYVTAEGKISGLTVDRRDVGKVVGMASYWGYQKMIFSAYACGSKLIMDELEPALEYGED
ncbi:hypothetical protein J2766_001159 [Agrobacterium tumefaciens]|uniref:Gp42 n=1 Tax=Agrobacterium tumefaciens TaxID=358 RepID=A0AAW8LSM3_AGRTU|nr:hypothetical protein [Agrobacterium tumefaciens]MBP2564600.1 hypothetical protein [Agrobacterium tumefaciens]MDR6701535.1 hypothetical protein [Agrobacterium tumefaciens]